MPANRSNVELRDDAQALAAKLGREVDTQGLNNPQLVSLVDELQKAVDGAETAAADAPPSVQAPPAVKPLDTPAPINGWSNDSIGGPPEAEAPSVPQGLYPLSVAPGKSIIGPRGHLVAGDEFKIEDVHGDKKRLRELIAQGFVVTS